MASALDLEEQEQLDQLKHFWNRWGNLISWVLIAVLGAYAAWNGWQYWQNRQASQAAVLFDTVEQAAQRGDVTLLERSLGDIQDKFGSTTMAHQAALLAGKTFFDKNESDKAEKALTWVTQKADDAGLVALARLRLASLALQAKSVDKARQWLSADVPAAFQPLFADRLGDLDMQQGQTDKAREQYLKAWRGLDARAEYRQMVAVKLAALGVDPTAQGASK
jgi:predicted negative regulator of RcsB-dependent stress response